MLILGKPQGVTLRLGMSHYRQPLYCILILIMHPALCCMILYDIAYCRQTSALRAAHQVYHVCHVCVYCYGIEETFGGEDRRTFPNIDFECLVTISSKKN